MPAFHHSNAEKTPFCAEKSASGRELARRLSGKAVPAPVRPRFYSPSEFAGELKELGLNRCERWVAHQCKAGRIAYNTAFKGRYLIPQSELFRLLGIREAQQ